MEVYANIHRINGQAILAICDVEILGKTFCESNLVFKVNETFFKGFKTSLEKALDLIDEATITNLVGCNIVKKAIEINGGVAITA